MYDLDTFCDGDIEEIIAQLYPEVIEFKCRFCGVSFSADSDMGGYMRRYGCGCVPEFVLDNLPQGMKWSALQSYSVRRVQAPCPYAGNHSAYCTSVYRVTANGTHSALVCLQYNAMEHKYRHEAIEWSKSV